MTVDTTICLLVAAVAMTDESSTHTGTRGLGNDSPSTVESGMEGPAPCTVMSREDWDGRGMGVFQVATLVLPFLSLFSVSLLSLSLLSLSLSPVSLFAHWKSDAINLSAPPHVRLLFVSFSPRHLGFFTHSSRHSFLSSFVPFVIHLSSSAL